MGGYRGAEGDHGDEPPSSADASDLRPRLARPAQRQVFFARDFLGDHSSAFPLVTNLVAYFAVTEGQGSLPVRMELVDVDEERATVFDAEGIFIFEHPRQVIEGTFAFENLEIPEPGEYRLKLFVGGEFLMERALHISGPRQGIAE